MKPNIPEINAKIIAKAWKDPAFKKRLMQNPREVFKEFGLDIPENLHITVLEERPKELHISIPPAPVKIDEISDKDLNLLSGGTTGLVCTLTLLGGCGS